ncbi:Phosphatidylcholine/phosphatidylserine synthase [Candidatus Cyrtobacter comes]|uniref:CDP-diacylglycerol--serine O-phosphatidyltransferase n=1 Tax=Candidatus Cyrtobacter comes TaxID=675776 RepID=A0ABU5L744_9RICK|nr:CDP-diacylglycerol--serine O-phosphatidyltransferase [Candidatus Cyrtobacter comes]MDZ5761952.1 Phosphatidylcholine/phosphatidylserine synthase [Candidatus Cyrtobacter comes]
MNQQKSSITLASLIPNIVTLFALCLGSTAIRYSLDLKFETAVSLIVIAAIIDGLDGRIARFLNLSSNFGAQLDSLADLVNFGIAPGIAIYIWSLSKIPYRGIGWAIVLFYIVCSAFRLARFNAGAVGIHKEKSGPNMLATFEGVPMPVAAVLSMMPMMVSFINHDIAIYSNAIAVYVVIIAILMVSSMPTPSIKNITINRNNLPISIALLGAFITAALLEPWIVLPTIGALYLIALPFFAHYSRKK